MAEAPFPDLVPLVEKARQEGLWFHGMYHDIYMSVDELEAQWAKGEFRWGAVNWELVTPECIRERQFDSKIRNLEKARANFEARVLKCRAHS